MAGKHQVKMFLSECQGFRMKGIQGEDSGLHMSSTRAVGTIYVMPICDTIEDAVLAFG